VFLKYTFTGRPRHLQTNQPKDNRFDISQVGRQVVFKGVQ